MPKSQQAAYTQQLTAHLRHYGVTAFPPPNGLFDSKYSEQRTNPPVFTKEQAHLNVLVPGDPVVAECIRRLVPRGKRHRWFGSMKSSQALALSVFGALKELERTDCLQQVMADDDAGPAFGSHPLESRHVKLEHDVDTLNEPRSTSIDVLIVGPTVVCVECKLSEAEVGHCSRPRLKKDHAEYCDGSYRQQGTRTGRCALTERGIAYWRCIPGILKQPEWDADRDHDHCPLAHPYQLVRNILAACVDDGRVVPDRGHALVVYDARNPVFAPHAGGTFETLREQLVEPKLLRRCSWQAIIAAMAGYKDLRWLVQGLEEKYGLNAA